MRMGGTKGYPIWAAIVLAFLADYSRCFVYPLTAICWYFVGLFIGILWVYQQHFADSLSAFCWRFCQPLTGILVSMTLPFCRIARHYSNFRLLALLENIILERDKHSSLLRCFIY